MERQKNQGKKLQSFIKTVECVFDLHRLSQSLLSFLKISTLALLLAALIGCESQVVLHEKLSEDEANEIYSVLLSRGLSAKKMAGKDGYSVAVSQTQAGQALNFLREEGLPKTRTDSLGEVFKKENMISSPLEERARYLYALSQELEKTLLSIDGVISARVHVVLPEQPTPGRPLVPSSAAVFVKYRSETEFGRHIPKVRQLVHNSIPGLPSVGMDSVSVIALPSESTSGSHQEIVWLLGIGVLKQSAGTLSFLLISLITAGVIGVLITYLICTRPLWLVSRIEKWIPALKHPRG